MWRGHEDTHFQTPSTTRSVVHGEGQLDRDNHKPYGQSRKERQEHDRGQLRRNADIREAKRGSRGRSRRGR